MSVLMRSRTARSDGSHIFPFMHRGRYHRPGLAPRAVIFAQKVRMSMPKVGDDSSHGPKPELKWPVSFCTSGGEYRCQPSSITTYGRFTSPSASETTNAA